MSWHYRRLQNGVCSNNLVLKRNFLGSTFLARSGYLSQIGNDLFGVFGLSSSRFTSNQHRLILAVSQHVTVSSLGDSPQVWWNFISSLTKIHFYTGGGVNWVSFVWVDDNTEETRVGIDKLSLESDIQVVEDRSIIKVSQVSHVLDLFELGWIDLPNFSDLKTFFSCPHMTVALPPSLLSNIHSMKPCLPSGHQ